MLTLGYFSHHVTVYTTPAAPLPSKPSTNARWNMCYLTLLWSTFCSIYAYQPWTFTGGTDAEGEAPILWPRDVKSQVIGKDPDAGKDWGLEEKGVAEDEMVGWHHWLNGHELEQALGDGERQGSLACCSPWGHRVGYDGATEQQQCISNITRYTLNLHYVICQLHLNKAGVNQKRKKERKNVHGTAFRETG